MVGDGTGDMALSRPVIRAEFVKKMTAASPYKDSMGSGYGASLFKDVKSGHWACEYIQLGVEQGWFNGYVDGTFRPDNTITLEEACTALLRLLGYDSSSLAGSFPTAQLSKASAIGLLDGVAAVRGQLLTRQDCVSLFYNPLLAQSSAGAVYGTTLGYTITGGEVDYASLVSTGLKGPFVTQSGELDLPFGAEGLSLYQNGTLSGLSAVSPYDVYYYNAGPRTVWVYSQKATGMLSAISPNRVSPTSVTVAGTTYSLGTSSAIYQLSSQGSFSEGDLVTLLLGMNSEVVEVLSAGESGGIYYGVVSASAKTTSSTDNTASVRAESKVVCTDGVTRTFSHSGNALTAGRLVKVTVDKYGTEVERLSEKTLSGKVNSAGTRLGNESFSDDVEILDTAGNGNAIPLYPSRLANVTLESGDVLFYTLDEAGAVDRLILNDVTADMGAYVYVTSANSVTEGMHLSGTYSYLRDGSTQTVTGSTVYNVSVGGAVLLYEGGTLKSIRQLSSVKLTDISPLYAMADNRKYDWGENLQVLLKSGGAVYQTSLSEINAQDYTLQGWYDDLGHSAGGRIRILTATPKN